MWPVPGDTDDEVMTGAINFIRKKLEVPHLECNDWQIKRARRVKSAKNATILHECLVTFNDIYSRDRVSAHGKNLRHYYDDHDRPTAGMRIDYPAHLGHTFRLLEWYGREMRLIHG